MDEGKDRPLHSGNPQFQDQNKQEQEIDLEGQRKNQAMKDHAPDCQSRLYRSQSAKKPREADEKESPGENQEDEDEGEHEDDENNDEDQENEQSGNQQHRKKQDHAKSGRKASSESIRESQQENDNLHAQSGGGKKCFNKLCQSKKIHKKIRSRVQTARYRFFCKSCYDNYLSNFFCEFCQQIYSNYENEEEDMNKWVGCDKCERWNHIECQRKFRQKNFDISNNAHYECLLCTKKNRNGTGEAEGPKRKGIEREYDNTRNYKAKVQISKEDRIPIFHKKPETFPCLQSFLQGYNFRLWINENLIREDIEAMRSLIRRPAVQEQPKKVKKIKQD